jgi:hypothetical protein
MKRPTSTSKKTSGQKSVIGVRAFAAITAVEGLALSSDSKRRLKSLQADASLTPQQRRDAVLRAYAKASPKK